MTDDGMHLTSRENAPTLSRDDGVVSRLLHGASGPDGPDGPEDDTALTVTWVAVEPGAEQIAHSHGPEQVYVVVAGEGRMRVDDEQCDVSAGDAVHVPSGATHGVANTGDEPLEYVSAATPAIPQHQIEAFYDE